MKIEHLTKWQIATIEHSVELTLVQGYLDRESGEALLDKLRWATGIRLSYEV